MELKKESNLKEKGWRFLVGRKREETKQLEKNEEKGEGWPFSWGHCFVKKERREKFARGLGGSLGLASKKEEGGG